MLSGLILSVTLLVLVSMLMVPSVFSMGVSEDESRYRFLGYIVGHDRCCHDLDFYLRGQSLMCRHFQVLSVRQRQVPLRLDPI